MYAALCRKPLMNPAYVPVPDSAVHLSMNQVTTRLQKQLLSRQLTSLQRYLATRLGEYHTPPAMPMVEELNPCSGLRVWVDEMTAANGIAFMMRSPEEVNRVTKALNGLEEALPSLSEDELFRCGADLLRLLADHYRRTGKTVALQLMEQLRLRLPDCSGLLHSFPQELRVPFRQSEENTEYSQRMERFATGKLAADCLAISALLGQFSGSGRDLEAAAAGLKALNRWHGLPCGAFSAEPHLAGNDPARSADLHSVCALIEACADALQITGNPVFANTLSLLKENALPALVEDQGVFARVSGNRLSPDEIHVPTDEEMTDLLKACYAIRRITFLQSDDRSVTCMIPAKGTCGLRIEDARIQVECDVRGFFRREAVWKVTADQPAELTLNAFIPSFADGARLLLNDGDPRMMGCGRFAKITRDAFGAWELKMQLNYTPRTERFARESQAVYCGEKLLCLPLPEEDSGYGFAVLEGEPLESGTLDGAPCVKATACKVLWPAVGELTTPAPQGVVVPASGEAETYQLTLLPAVEHRARIVAFPMAERR